MFVFCNAGYNSSVDINCYQENALKTSNTHCIQLVQCNISLKVKMEKSFKPHAIESRHRITPLLESISLLLKHGYTITVPKLDSKLQSMVPVLVVWLWTHIILFLGPLTFTAMLYMLLMTHYWWIPVTYCTWVMADMSSTETGGRHPWVRRVFRGMSVWRHWCQYFHLTLVKTADLEPGQNYLIGSHPHGICAAGAFGAFSTDGAGFSRLFPGLSAHLHTLTCNFFAPLHRDWLLALGINSTSRQALTHNLTKPEGGQASVLVVGGAAEALLSDSQSLKLILNKRKGFIKVAIQTGASLVPAFTFGETKLYSQIHLQHLPILSQLQALFKAVTGVAPCLFNGRGLLQTMLGLMPRRVPLTVVVGQPIRVEQCNNPTVEQINELHAQYVSQLVNIYETYKHKYGDKHIQLEIL